MNYKRLALIVGIFVLTLGIGGLLLGEQQVAGINMDLLLDTTRIALGIILIVASTRTADSVKTTFALFGIVYLANFLIALVSPTMFGALPHEYGMMDNFLHSIGGVLGLGIAYIANPTRRRAAI